MNKLSEIIYFTLEAVREAEARGSEFKVDMYIYHDYNAQANMCIANSGGLAAIKRWGGMSPISVTNQYEAAEAFNIEWLELVLFEVAVDELSEGRVYDASLLLNVENPGVQYSIMDYHIDSEQWHKDMEGMADCLASKGH